MSVFSGLKPKFRNIVAVSHIFRRPLTVTGTTNQKKIVVETKGNKTIVEGVDVTQNDNILNLDNLEGYCPTCPEKLGFKIDYTDVLLVSQFVSPDGQVLPRATTGLCERGHNRMKVLIYKAQTAGLMPECMPNYGGQEPIPQEKRYKWKKFNTFFKTERLPYRI